MKFFISRWYDFSKCLSKYKETVIVQILKTSFFSNISCHYFYGIILILILDFTVYNPGLISNTGKKGVGETFLYYIQTEFFIV